MEKKAGLCLVVYLTVGLARLMSGLLMGILLEPIWAIPKQSIGNIIATIIVLSLVYAVGNFAQLAVKEEIDFPVGQQIVQVGMLFFFFTLAYIIPVIPHVKIWDDGTILRMLGATVTMLIPIGVAYILAFLFKDI